MSELNRQLEDIEKRWSDGDAPWSYEAFLGDLQLVKDTAAGKVGGAWEQKRARIMLCGYFEAQGEPDRAEELLYTLLDATDDVCEQVGYRERLFKLHYAHREEIGAERLRQDYEAYARSCFAGILEHEDTFTAGAVLRSGSAAEQMEDYALLAAAAYLESFLETNVVDQLAAEVRYRQTLEQFHALPSHLADTPQGRYRLECLDQLAKLELRKRCDAEMRWVYLAMRWAAEKDVNGMRYPRNLRGAWAWAAALAQRAKAFQETYPFDVLRMPQEGVEEYKELAGRFMRALELGNPAVAQWIMEHTEVFEQMWDYSILAAACMIWATHEANKDPDARREAGEAGKKWLDVLLGTMVDANGAPSCFRKWGGALPVQMKTRMKWQKFLHSIATQVAQDYPRDWLSE